MASVVQSEKVLARKLVSAALKALTDEQMAHQSLAICDRVLGADFFAQSRRVGVYVSCPRLREVDTSRVLSHIFAAGSGKRCYAPLIRPGRAQMQMLHIESLDELVANKMQILEPPEAYADGRPRESAAEMDDPLDLILVPGVAFDATGRRLGRGGGYYDNFLEEARKRAKRPVTVGLAFGPQLLDSVPTDPHDQPVDYVCSADGLLRTGAGAAP